MASLVLVIQVALMEQKQVERCRYEEWGGCDTMHVTTTDQSRVSLVGSTSVRI